jgi:tetratricopeptide (TPR) repeat protein
VNKSFLIIVTLSAFIFGGCGTTLKQQWYDFTAYYNTFYNANQYFDEAYKENRSLASPINPNDLIRIHPPPTSGGAQNFERSIEKSADILRNHSRSKYVDDAIELIGVSYFYRQEYFAALEKFQELYSSTDNPETRMSATLWEGRTYLELGLYGEGARFMESRIEQLEHWTPGNLSEARAILAQLYAYQGDLHQAGNQLLIALEYLEGRDLRPRAYFHYGQIMERMNNYTQASFAFHAISDMRPSFELEYHAKLKETEILRLQGNYEEAGRQLRSMSRDDKFYDYRLELLYQVARTERLKGNPQTAEEYFQNVLRSRTITPARDLIARTYYGLAEIHRFNYNNLRMAAAYYDSAAMTSVDRNLLPENWDAANLASSFGEYAEVAEEIAHLDSLLTLGRLSPEEFDEKIAEIRQQRMAEIERQRIEQDSWDAYDRQMDLEDAIEVTTEETSHGFLNINNRTLLDQSGMQFRALWGNRPLADNWRRQEAVTGSGVNFDDQRAVVQTEEPDEQESEEIAVNMQLDIGQIPFEIHEQDSVEVLIYTKYYQLGNIFQMNLGMPDSAKVYYEKVIDRDIAGSPRASSMYALMDILAEDGEMDRALAVANQLIETYPQSRLAQRAADRLNLQMPVISQMPMLSFEPLSEVDLSILLPEQFSDTLNADYYAGALLLYAERSQNREQAARYMLDAVEIYIKAAMDDTLYNIRQNRWQEVAALAGEYESLEDLMQGVQDTVVVHEMVIQIPGLEESEYLTIEDMQSLYPYNGVYWYRSREILKQIIDIYRGTRAAERAAILLGELEKYPELIVGGQPIEPLQESPDDRSGE